MCEFVHFITLSGANWRISYHLPVLNNGSRTLILTCTVSNDLNPAYTVLSVERFRRWFTTAEV